MKTAEQEAHEYAEALNDIADAYGLHTGATPTEIAEASRCAKWLLDEVIRYRRGLGRYDFSRYPSDERETRAIDAWAEIEAQIEEFPKL